MFKAEGLDKESDHFKLLILTVLMLVENFMSLRPRLHG